MIRAALLALLTILPLDARAQSSPIETGTSAEFRAASAPSDSVVWAGGSGGVVARSIDAGTTWRVDTIAGATDLFLVGIHAADQDTAVVLGTGFETSAARIYRTEDGGASWTESYTDSRDGIFLDGLAFWEEGRGVAFGDPLDGVFVVLTTADGGRSWSMVPDSVLPPALDGEAGFAASGRALVTGPDGRAWFGTGGAERARVFRTTDYGQSWHAFPAPLPSGATAGIFAIAFRDTLNGIAVGGDHTQRTVPGDNVLRTIDGGGTWTVVGGAQPAGVRYGAQFGRTGSDAVLIAVGPSGAGVSTDDGEHWTVLDRGHWNTVAPRPDFGWLFGPDGRIMRVEW